MRFLIVCILCAFLGYVLVLGISSNFEMPTVSKDSSQWFDDNQFSEIWSQLKRRFWDQDIPSKRREAEDRSAAILKKRLQEMNQSAKPVDEAQDNQKSNRAEFRDLSPQRYKKGLAASEGELLESQKRKKNAEKQQLNQIIKSITE